MLLSSVFANASCLEMPQSAHGLLRERGTQARDVEECSACYSKDTTRDQPRGDIAAAGARHVGPPETTDRGHIAAPDWVSSPPTARMSSMLESARRVSRRTASLLRLDFFIQSNNARSAVCKHYFAGITRIARSGLRDRSRDDGRVSNKAPDAAPGKLDQSISRTVSRPSPPAAV